MKTKFGAIIVDGRGKIGGHVASKNRSGAYLRTKVTPVNPQSAGQSVQRSILTSTAQAWKSLTEAERNSWNAAVPQWSKTDIFGDIKNPSGFNLFVKLNSNLAQAGFATITVAPLAVAVDNCTIVSGVANAAGSSLIITDDVAAVPADHTLLIGGTASVSAGVSSFKGKSSIFRKIFAAGATNVNIYSYYVAKFGTPIAGQKCEISFQTVNENTGQKGAISRVQLVWA